ncbi:MAG: hypothetical protein ACRCRT_04465, partial [Cetobacterium somerae]
MAFSDRLPQAWKKIKQLESDKIGTNGGTITEPLKINRTLVDGQDGSAGFLITDYTGTPNE